MRITRRACAGVFLAAVLVSSGCGGGGSMTSPRPNTDPAGWKRCVSAYHGFSVAYPGRWHVATYQRLHVLGKGEAYRRGFFRNVACMHYDPHPFTVYDGTEGPTTAVTILRVETPREFRQMVKDWFSARSVRTIERERVSVGGYSAIRFRVYVRPGALWDRSHVYGYLIDFGRKGGLVMEAWRYGFKPIPWKQYRAHMAVVDRMAPTVLVS